MRCVLDSPGDFNGTIEKLVIPAGLSNSTSQMKQNNFIATMQATTNAPVVGQSATPVPAHVGEPSLFQHVFYIIKENKHYDQIFGDIVQGNGEASLCIYGTNVTPNQHALANQFVLLDNYYCTGVFSDDGHLWCTQGIESDQPSKASACDSAHASDALAENSGGFSSTGFIWDNISRHSLIYTNYGEFVYTSSHGTNCWATIYSNYLIGMYPGGHLFSITNTNAAFPSDGIQNLTNLYAHTSYYYPGWDTSGTGLNVPDVLRADVFIYDLTNADLSGGNWPAFTIMHLPNDHTGAFDTNCAPGPSGAAEVADNDLAVGKIVDAISHSRFWSNSVIFIIEDDAQGTGDHVDGHRSICLVASPYTKRRQTISSFYNQPGLVHTMEQILGIPPMNQMDAIGPLMSDCFSPLANFTPFVCQAALTPLTNTVRLNNLTPEELYWVRKSHHMDYSRPDRADLNVLNHLAWIEAKGHIPYPSKYTRTNEKNLKKLGLFATPRKDIDDDD